MSLTKISEFWLPKAATSGPWSKSGSDTGGSPPLVDRQNIFNFRYLSRKACAVHNILLVDDDPAFRGTMSAFLEDEGFFVRAVASGDEGIALIRQKLVSFSFALVDYHMPEIQGACREVERRVKPVSISTHTENQKLITAVGMIGVSESMSEVARLIQKFGPANDSVLIRGENGTGKEKVARAIHNCSPRSIIPFIAESDPCCSQTTSSSHH